MTTSRLEHPLRMTPGAVATSDRDVAIEAPVAIEVDGFGYAVMMMTPADLEDFARGFMLTERLADTVDDIVAIDLFESERGWILRIALANRCRGRIADRVRHRTSDTGCGLCGISGLEQIERPLPGPAPRPAIATAALFHAIEAIRSHQPLNRETGAVHAAALCSGDGHILLAREDVGRHNALDKLIGALAAERQAIGGFLLLTSRVSFEMVDKALVARAPMVVGISAPTSMAIDHARAHGLTLVALARPDAVLVFNDPWDIFGDGSGGGT
jgi:FdhD protein